jgi:hypothetical protein
MKYLKSYNESMDEITPQQIVINDISDILIDIEDLGYKTSVGLASEISSQISSSTALYSNPKLLTLEIYASEFHYINLADISDTLVRIYDYMKDHQKSYKKYPNVSKVFRPGYPDSRVEIVGWGQLDKRNVRAYNQLLNSTSLGFTKIKIQWEIKL